MDDVARWRHAHAFGTDRAADGERRTRWVVAITVVMMAAEIVAGTAFGSMALLADGWHMGTHAAALGVAVFAYVYARRHAADPRYSFGTGKVGALGGFASAVGLAVVALLVFVESVARLAAPVAIRFDEAIAVAFVGLAVNLGCAWLLRDRGHDHRHGHHHDHDHDHDHEHPPRAPRPQPPRRLPPRPRRRAHLGVRDPGALDRQAARLDVDGPGDGHRRRARHRALVGRAAPRHERGPPRRRGRERAARGDPRRDRGDRRGPRRRPPRLAGRAAPLRRDRVGRDDRHAALPPRTRTGSSGSRTSPTSRSRSTGASRATPEIG